MENGCIVRGGLAGALLCERGRTHSHEAGRGVAHEDAVRRHMVQYDEVAVTQVSDRWQFDLVHLIGADPHRPAAHADCGRGPLQIQQVNTIRAHGHMGAQCLDGNIEVVIVAHH